MSKEHYYYHLGFTVPFDINLSKNKMWRRTRFGRTYLNPLTKNLMETITNQVRVNLSMCKVKPVVGKVYLGIHVYKPDNRADAINFVDALADAVKVGLDVDDRWFCITRLDWSIDKDRPRIDLEIGQKVDEDCRICAQCSEIRPGREFWMKTKVCLMCKSDEAPESLSELPEIQ